MQPLDFCFKLTNRNFNLSKVKYMRLQNKGFESKLLKILSIINTLVGVDGFSPVVVLDTI